MSTSKYLDGKQCTNNPNLYSPVIVNGRVLFQYFNFVVEVRGQSIILICKIPDLL